MKNLILISLLACGLLVAHSCDERSQPTDTSDSSLKLVEGDDDIGELSLRPGKSKIFDIKGLGKTKIHCIAGNASKPQNTVSKFLCKCSFQSKHVGGFVVSEKGNHQRVKRSSESLRRDCAARYPNDKNLGFFFYNAVCDKI